MINCQHADVCLQRFKNYLKCKCCFPVAAVHTKKNYVKSTI